MKKLSLVFPILFCIASSFSEEISSISAISEIRVTSYQARPYVYVQNTEGNWSVCNGTKFLVINSETNGAVNEMLSVFLTAKSTGIKVKAKGNCNTNNHLEVATVYFDPK